MFCKKCGERIDDDSAFCCKCGARQTAERAEDLNGDFVGVDKKSENVSSVAPSVLQSPEEEERKSGCSVLIVFAIFVFIICAGVMTMLVLNGRVSCSVDGSRNANTGDISVDTDLNILELGIDVIVTPKEDISDLELTLVYCDNVGKELKTQKLYIGDVRDGVKTKKTVQITEFSLTEALQISSVKIRVSGGTVD